MSLITLDIISCTLLCPIPSHAMISLSITLWSTLLTASAICLLLSMWQLLANQHVAVQQYLCCHLRNVSPTVTYWCNPYEHLSPYTWRSQSTMFAAETFSFIRNWNHSTKTYWNIAAQPFCCSVLGIYLGAHTPKLYFILEGKDITIYTIFSL